MEMRKLSTIQKREKLNTVFAADEPGVGNANHKYVVVCGDEGFFDSLTALHDDLTTDHLQPIFQYYIADRKEKMQDYTPSCLGRLIAKLNHIENANSCYDMCAGSELNF